MQALVLLGPGHVPLRFYNNPNITTVRESVDLARVLVKDGKGDTRRSFGDINQGRRLIVADGAASPLADALGAARLEPRRARHGLRTHYSGVEGLGEDDGEGGGHNAISHRSFGTSWVILRSPQIFTS